MRKSIFLLAVGAIALTACTQSELVEEGVQSNAIGFQNMVSKETRVPLTNGSLGKFYVYAYYTPTEGENIGNAVQVFSGDEVSLSGTEWTYSPARYWVPNAQYYFYAYSCENTNLRFGTSGMNLNEDNDAARALRISNFICDNTHQHDFVIAKKGPIKGKTASTDIDNPANGKVALNFKHILTKINVKFKSDFAPGYDIEISEVSITNIKNRGSYSAASETWSAQERTKEENATEGDYGTFVEFQDFVDNYKDEDNNIASKGETAAADLTATTTDCYVLPSSYTTTDGDVKLRFNINVVDKATRQSILKRNMAGSWAPNWISGMAYTYTVNITGNNADLEPIVFETASDMNLEWSTGSTGSVDMTFSAN